MVFISQNLPCLMVELNTTFEMYTMYKIKTCILYRGNQKSFTVEAVFVQSGYKVYRFERISVL